MDYSSLLAQVSATSGDGGISGIVIWIGLVVLLIIFFIIVTRAFGPKRPPEQLEEKPEAPEEEAPEEEAPEEEAPEEEDDADEPAVSEPTLKQIRAAKAVKLGDTLKSPEALQKARDARKGKTSAPIAVPVEAPEPEQEPAEEETPQKPEQKSLAEGLERTRSGFIGRLKGIFSRKPALDDVLLDEIEEVLFTADIGINTSQQLLELVQKKLQADDGQSSDEVWEILREETSRILLSNEKPLVIGNDRPFVILVIGVNGVGKTTTIGKLASRFRDDGHSVMMIAGDTFRAAAAAQLEIWGERTGCVVHTGKDHADPSAVVFDGIRRAVDEKADIVLIDTAGRLHTKTNLMEELRKIQRVAGKAFSGAPHQCLLVLDANTGQNAISQAQLFTKEVGVTGIVLTKLDGTAKGGVVIGISDELNIPVQFIGIGEQVNDLRTFDASEFVDALF
jgi:fused signal recognition particle receptor